MLADQVAVQAHTSPEQTVFLVSRRAAGEHTSLAWRRLRSAKSYLADKGLKNTIVMADGETRAKGGVEFYVGSTLVATVDVGYRLNLYFYDTGY
jgi:hypothetical protein